MITRKYMQVVFEVDGYPDVFAGTVSMIRPDRVVVERKDYHGYTAYVHGPIVRKDKTLSARRSRGIFGTFGLPLPQAPDWVNKLVRRVEAMENLDAQG